MNDLPWMTLAEAAGAIAARKLSPVELMTALLERIGRLDPKLNVFIRLDGEAAMAEARAAEAEIVSGRLRGPLHGVPVGIKDIIDVAGLPTTCHSKICVVLDVSDPRAHGPAGHLLGEKGREQGLEFGRVEGFLPSQTGHDSGVRTTGMRL
jgi:hypothetical protein